MTMSRVTRCEVSECAYNMDDVCHAKAITIGDTIYPKCDTYCASMVKGGDDDCVAGVGACKVASCIYNSDLECESPEICVGYEEDEADCLTFESR